MQQFNFKGKKTISLVKNHATVVRTVRPMKATVAATKEESVQIRTRNNSISLAKKQFRWLKTMQQWHAQYDQ